MNWKTLAALPILGLVLWIVVSAIEFGNAVGSTWSDSTTSTLVNGLVMMCWGSGLLFAIIAALLIGVALATRILQTPVPRTYDPPAQRGGYGHRAGLLDRLRGRTGPGWDEPAGWGNEGGYIEGSSRVVGVEPPLQGMRPMLGPSAGTPINMLPGPSGAFDAMEDGNDGRYRG